MANELLNLVWPLQLESSGEKFVLIALADAANTDGWCSMCADTIAYKTGLHARTVKTLLRLICKRGLIYINERLGRSSEFLVNKVALEAWQKAATWLKNQQLKTERVEKLKAQIQAAAPEKPVEKPVEKPIAKPAEGTVAWLSMMSKCLGIEEQGYLESTVLWTDRVKRAIKATQCTQPGNDDAGQKAGRD